MIYINKNEREREKEGRKRPLSDKTVRNKKIPPAGMGGKGRKKERRREGGF